MSDRYITKDNIIYANFGGKPRITPIPPPKRTRRGAHASTAGARILAAVETQTDQGRLSRGRAYAQQGNVVSLHIGGGRIQAQIAGSQNEPFNTEMILPHRTATQLSTATEALVESPGGLQRVRRGEADETLLDALIATDPGEIRFRCDCPDLAVVCKHDVALAEELARRLTTDPTAIFSLRDLSFSQLEEMMTRHARAVSHEAATSSPELFWQGRELPGLPEPNSASVLVDSDRDLLAQAMRVVSYTTIEQLRALSDLEEVYGHLTRS